jgi:hypothetical protein
MSLNAMKINQPLRVGLLSGDPSSPENGEIYYNTSTNKFRKYENGAWADLDTAGSGTFSDATFRVQDNGDATKQIAMEASGITTGTTRTITMPDANVNLALVLTALQNVVEDTSPSLGGDLDMNGENLMGLMKRSAVASPTLFVEQQYIHDTTLTAATTDVLAALTFAHATYSAIQVDYVIRQDTSLKTRSGRLSVVTDGTVVSITDTYNETADAEISWSAAIDGADVEISYTNADGSLDAHVRLDVKRFLVANS